MTAVDDRRVQEAFENLVVPEGFKAELIRGEIVMMAGPDKVHNRIVQSVQDQIPSDRWERLQTQDVAIPGEDSEPQPDLVVMEIGADDSPGRLVPAPAVTMLVEVVSRTSAHRDYVEKRSIYAAGAVPVYLVVDPFAGKCLVLTEPSGTGLTADYQSERTRKFGDPVRLPLVDIDLDTSRFGTLPPFAATP
ncbi:Uma2 family endonuclease [Streptomyces naphthomycinicus]|uniref:Uma2 family endonuclease n=1 Tax=Streptomyces naphthomycinicus TaxID=2872625 RepID=UPI001CEDA449|nr:Uma2 family endonuclease [Streptomyces sp. TML10]